MLTLYHYPLCPFSRKIRLFLGEQKIGVDLIIERFWENRKEFIKLNPSGEVPVMLAENTKFCGHYAISEYIENKFEETIPKDILNRAENRRLIDWFDNKFHKEVSKIIIDERVEKRFRSIEKGGGLPNYTDLKREGLDHDPIFHVEVKLQNGLTSIGKAKSKRKAQQNAAKKLLSHIRNSNDR